MELWPQNVPLVEQQVQMPYDEFKELVKIEAIFTPGSHRVNISLIHGDYDMVNTKIEIFLPQTN
jgi:hypothetical protein